MSTLALPFVPPLSATENAESLGLSPLKALHLSGLSGLSGLAKRTRKRGKALTVLEGILAIGLLALVLSAVFVGGRMLLNSIKTSNAAKDYATMSAETRVIYANQGNFTGVSPQTLVDLGVVPRTNISGSTIVSGWKTTVEVAPTNLNGVADDGIEFTYTVPREVCTKFVAMTGGMAARAKVDGVVVKDVSAGQNNLDATTLGTSCKASTGGNATILLAQGL